MMMKKVIVGIMILLVISSQMESVKPDASDCLDACTTGCVQRDSRLQQRCERKCQIRCGPDVATQKVLGGVNNIRS